MDYLDLSLAQNAEALRTGAVKAETYVDGLLERCEQLSDLGAFITLDAASSRLAAREADQRRASGERLGPLHGIPLGVKDNIDVAGLPATLGTPALSKNVPRRDAGFITRLRNAGAIIVGKTNMQELAAGVKTNNGAFGTGRNPYARDHVPGGSSGGSAIAVSSRMLPGAIGTDTGASNRLPAAHCGVVGFRPTTGRWPQHGLGLASPTFDTAGPMARTVEDCAILDAVVVGGPEKFAEVDRSALRIGVPMAMYWEALDDGVRTVVENALDRLRDAGFILVEADMPPAVSLAQDTMLGIGMYELKVAMENYLRHAESSLTFEDVIEQLGSADVKPLFAEWADATSFDTYGRQQLQRLDIEAAFRNHFDDVGLDATIYPTSPAPAQVISQDDRMLFQGSWQSEMVLNIRHSAPAATAGVPSISVPAGVTTAGLPVGISLDGRAGGDRRLLAIAAEVASVLPPMPAPALGN